MTKIHLNKYPKDVSDDEKIEYMQRVLKVLAEAPDRFVIDEKQYDEFMDDLSTAHKLVYLTDNCGEIVMDKLLIREIQKKYPNLRVTVLVRGTEVINDATMEDARQVGLTEMVKVIPNGSDIAGIWLEDISEEAESVLDEAERKTISQTNIFLRNYIKEA